MNFLLITFSVNVNESAENCGFGHINRRSPQWKASFFCAMSVRILNHKYPTKLLKNNYNLNQYSLVSTKNLISVRGSKLWIILLEKRESYHPFPCIKTK